MVHLSLFCPLFCSEFGDVERRVKVCTGVWIRDFLADFLLLRQRPKFQVIPVYCDVILKLSESKRLHSKEWQADSSSSHLTFSVKFLNFCSTITAASYAGLIYLGLRFLRKSIMNRGETVECDDERDEERCYLVGEEEAIWLLRLVLPYINEVLLNLRCLFSGEPATTMKVKPNSSE